MEIRYKLYPYPVLAYFSDDYVDSKFDTVIEVVKDGYNVKFTFLAETDNHELKKYISDGKVQFVYHLECAQTGFRMVVCTDEKEHTHIIPDKNLNGRLQICPFIIAKENIIDYINASFHEDYRGFKFNIEAGCVMAIGKQVNADIEKDINDLANTPSIFSIIKNSDESTLAMIVDMNKNKIVIKLQEKDYYNFKSIKDNPQVQPMLNSLVVIPALIYVLEELARRDQNERYEYSGYAWYRAVKKALQSRFNCNVESEAFNELNMLETAQKLINIPLADALQFLWEGYRNLGEDDEE
jgi:hypothetical protein